MSKEYHPRAGRPAAHADLTNIAQLVSAYFVNEVDARSPQQKVAFGTSGHRGCALHNSFNEAHILAISQALCAYREEQQITGPLFLGRDTHALSESAYMTALEVFIANGVEVRVQTDDGYVPTPVISHAILKYNHGRSKDLADGVVITPSHNPPTDGGFKYNPPHGGPADANATKTIEKYANAILSAELIGVNAVSYAAAKASQRCLPQDLRASYIDDLSKVVNMQAIVDANLHIGVDAMGGAGASYWPLIAAQYGLDITVYNNVVDPSFRFMSLDKDGQIRMDCSSPDAMAPLLALQKDFDVAMGNDPDYDRHGIVTPTHGLLNPNHYLAVAIDYLAKHRNWQGKLTIGKTLVSSAMIDRVAAANKLQLREMPVGFKWFAPELAAGTMGFAGEESAGATFADQEGKVWTTDKDGIILALLAAEITAVTGKNPGEYYADLCAQHGTAYYKRIDIASSAALNAAFADIRAYKLKLTTLAGEEVTDVMTKAPANDALIGGIKVVTEKGWFAARPSGTEPIYKIYCESFVSESHLDALAEEAAALVHQWLS